MATRSISGLEKVVWINPGLLENGSERTLGHISRMVWNYRVAVCLRAEAYFMATSGLAIKLEPSGLQLADNFAITEA